jgi:hypothetical protein
VVCGCAEQQGVAWFLLGLPVPEDAGDVPHVL